MKDLYEELNTAHRLDEETITPDAEFQRMKKWIEETDPTGTDLAYDGPFIDYVNEVYGTANEKVSEEYDEELYIEPSIQAGRGGVFMYGWGSEISWDFEEECDELLEFAKEATTHEEFLNSVTGYVSGKASTLADTAPYEEEDDDGEYDDDFDEGLIGTAIQAAKNLNPLNLFEGEGADTTRAIVDILDKTSAEDSNTWVKAVKDVVDVIPDEYMDNLFDIAKEKLSDVKLTDDNKNKVVDAAGVSAEGAEDADTVGKILSLIDITTWDAKTLKTYIIAVLGIVALIEPTPILEIITGILTLLPAEAVKAILSVTNMIGNPVGAIGTIANRARQSAKKEEVEFDDDI